MARGNTEILQHKVFFDLLFYTGRCGKEGLRKLKKDSFQIKTSAGGFEYYEVTFNEVTKKNQGDKMSTATDLLHNDHNIVKAQSGE